MKWVLMAALLMASATPTMATSISHHTCELYFGDEGDLPQEVREVLNMASRSAVRVCSVPGQQSETMFQLVSAPVRGAFGVCKITERRVFKDEGSWTYTPPAEKSYLGGRRVSMMVSDDLCPRQGDQRYVPANDITEGTFLALVRFWEHGASRRDHNAPFVSVYPAVRSGPMFQEFERVIRNGAKLDLAAVGFYRSSADGMAYYELELGRPFPSWSLIVDFVDDELTVLGIGKIE